MIEDLLKIIIEEIPDKNLKQFLKEKKPIRKSDTKIKKKIPTALHEKTSAEIQKSLKESIEESRLEAELESLKRS